MSDQLKSAMLYTQIVRLLQRLLESVAIGDFGSNSLRYLLQITSVLAGGQVDVAAQLGDARTA